MFPVTPNRQPSSPALNSFTKNDSPANMVDLSALNRPPLRVLVSVSMLPRMYTMAPASAVTLSPMSRAKSTMPTGFFTMSYRTPLRCTTDVK